MEPIGLTRVGFVLPVVKTLEALGAPVERLLATSGLPPWILADAEALIPIETTARLLNHGARLKGIENIGLVAGEAASIETLGLFGRLIRRCRTLGDALDATVRHHPMFSSNSRMWITHRGEDVELCQAFSNRLDEGWQQTNHYILMIMVALVRLGAGPSWRPAKVTLQTGKAPALRQTTSLSLTNPAFARPATSITFPRMLLDARLEPPSDPATFLHDMEGWAASAPALDFVGSVSQIVETLSAGGFPDIHRTADIIGTSVRTLQRRLAAAGCTHEELIGRARLSTAIALLNETQTRILDIALDLGYSDHSHFTRAFRRWMGCSPQKFRRRSVENATAVQ